MVGSSALRVLRMLYSSIQIFCSKFLFENILLEHNTIYMKTKICSICKNKDSEICMQFTKLIQFLDKSLIFLNFQTIYGPNTLFCMS